VRNEAIKNNQHTGKDLCKYALETMLQNQDHFLDRCHFPQAVIQPTSYFNKLSSSDVGDDYTEMGQRLRSVQTTQSNV